MPCAACGLDHRLVGQTYYYTCSTACIEMILAMNNQPTTLKSFQTMNYRKGEAMRSAAKLPTATATKRKAGLHADQVVALMREANLAVEATVCAGRTGSDIGTSLRSAKFPLMAEVNFDNGSAGGGLHWVVVTGRKRNLVRDDQFCVLDPCGPRYYLVRVAKTGQAGYTCNADGDADDIPKGRLMRFTGTLIQPR